MFIQKEFSIFLRKNDVYLFAVIHQNLQAEFLSVNLVRQDGLLSAQFQNELVELEVHYHPSKYGLYRNSTKQRSVVHVRMLKLELSIDSYAQNCLQYYTNLLVVDCEKQVKDIKLGMDDLRARVTDRVTHMAWLQKMLEYDDLIVKRNEMIDKAIEDACLEIMSKRSFEKTGTIC